MDAIKEDASNFEIKTSTSQETSTNSNDSQSRSLGGLHYNIQIILPATRDVAVYDALFRSLKEHILDG